MTASTPSDAPLRGKEPTEVEGPFALIEGRVASPTAVGTPEQQAALLDLQNGWYQDRVLEAYAATGTIEDAARIAGVSYHTVYRRQNDDPEFRAGLAQARRRFGERLLAKASTAVLHAEPEAAMNHPVLPIFLIKGYLPEFRDAGVQVDARQLTVNVLTDEQAAAVARALAGVPDGEELA